MAAAGMGGACGGHAGWTTCGRGRYVRESQIRQDGVRWDGRRVRRQGWRSCRQDDSRNDETTPCGDEMATSHRDV
ncbi:hypothetical protein GUJ93_ZPchr0012g20131 [Zizania palustris]|uniref:Uncharacterized protein n=1 Tax=Zizania palustris TaxID=103762 RepID=A0A8J6BQH6_ZIZPA|nr:hypothetical protein GUJ93_ZPchr0012g20131 [Zizania palustris]